MRGNEGNGDNGGHVGGKMQQGHWGTELYCNRSGSRDVTVLMQLCYTFPGHAVI